jgi:hypothetical protein
VQRLGGFGEVQIAPHGFLNETELVEIHIEMRIRQRLIVSHTI